MNKRDDFLTDASLADHPYPIAPDELPPAPRPAEWTGTARLVRGTLFLALLAVPNVVLLHGESTARPLRQLAQGPSGQSVTGKVSGVARRGSKSRTYWVYYTYEVGGRRASGSAQVSHSVYAACRKDSPVQVTYLPTHPETHCLGRPEDRLSEQNQSCVRTALLLAAGLGIGLAWLEFSLRRQLALARRGVAVVGKISERGQTRTKNGYTYWVYYRFTPLEGRTATTWVSVNRSTWDYLAPGTAITVLYDPDHPRRHRPLFAFNRVRFLPERSQEPGVIDEPGAPATGPSS
jgi:hypothetical protein